MEGWGCSQVWSGIGKQKASVLNTEASAVIRMAATYSPRGIAQVPLAMRGLTSLFGMGRGEHPRHNHHKKVSFCKAVIRLTYWERKTNYEFKKIKAYG